MPRPRAWTRVGGAPSPGDGWVYVAVGITEVRRQPAVNDTVVTRFASDGSLLWDRQFGGAQGDFPGGVAARADGTVAIAGETASFGAGSDDAFLLQIAAT